MRKLLPLLSLLALTVAGEASQQLVSGVDYSGRLLAKPKAGAAINGLNIRGRLEKLGIILVEVPTRKDPLAYAKELMSTGNFEYAHPDYICHPIGIPNDPQVMQQWHLFQISAPRAWDVTAGNATTVIAITDTGVDLSHPDLQNRVPGYNAVDRLAEVNGGQVSDIHSTGHGTRVTGLACATGNNGIGIAGVAYANPFMPIRISNQINGSAFMADILDGITWAVDHGAKVINTSYDHVEVPAVETTGEYAWSHGAISVWGAGNGNVDTKTLPDPDLDWDHKRVVVVGSTDQNDAKASFSNFGKGVDIFAPGTQLLTTNKGGGYGAVTGTSYSAPLVSAAFALSIGWAGLGTYPFERRFDNVLRASRDLGVSVEPGQPGYMPGNDGYWGWGRLNAAAGFLGWIQTLTYKLTELPSIPGYYSDARAVNDLGEVAGSVWIGGSSLAAKWSADGTLTVIPMLPGRQSYVTGMNNKGECVLTAWGGGIYDHWVYRYSNGVVTEFPLYGSDTVTAEDINEDGTIIGTLGHPTRRPFLWPKTAAPYPFYPGAGAWPEGLAINDNGWMTGRHGPYPEMYGWYYNGISYDGLVSYVNWGQSWPRRINNQNLAVGWTSNGGLAAPIRWDLESRDFDKIYDGATGHCFDINEFNEAVGDDDYNGQAWVMDGFRSSHLKDLLYEGQLPTGWSTLVACYAINNRHQIVGSARKHDGSWLAFRADPVEGIRVTVDLGQLGSNPIYLGALPPACVVEFRDQAGNYIPNSRIEYPYASMTGQLQVAIPPEVTGAYRMYFRLTNINDNPDYASGGWNGPGYLGKIYPPMTEPALPIDAIYVPDMVLYVGDCDSDNEIGISDYAVLSAAYGSFEGDTGWDRRADLDGDLEISIGDYAILSGNYGLAGD